MFQKIKIPMRRHKILRSILTSSWNSKKTSTSQEWSNTNTESYSDSTMFQTWCRPRAKQAELHKKRQKYLAVAGFSWIPVSTTHFHLYKVCVIFYHSTPCRSQLYLSSNALISSFFFLLHKSIRFSLHHLPHLYSPHVQIFQIDSFSSGPVLVVRLLVSWICPHVSIVPRGWFRNSTRTSSSCKSWFVPTFIWSRLAYHVLLRCRILMFSFIPTLDGRCSVLVLLSFSPSSLSFSLRVSIIMSGSSLFSSNDIIGEHHCAWCFLSYIFCDFRSLFSVITSVIIMKSSGLTSISISPKLIMTLVGQSLYFSLIMSISIFQAEHGLAP